MCVEAADALSALLDEIEVLRAALERILDAPMIDHSRPERSVYGIARQALSKERSDD